MVLDETLEGPNPSFQSCLKRLAEPAATIERGAMSTPEHSAAHSPVHPPEAGATSRRAFLGLGGAFTLAAATGVGPALAEPGPHLPHGGAEPGCPTGLDPAERTTPRAALARAARVAQATSDSLSPGTTPALSPSRVAGLPYLSRAQWGADESYRFTAAGVEIWPPTYWPVQTFTVHHTADGSTNPDNAARLRTIYHNQAVGEGYGDLGYHFVIDAAGTVYEGRWSGDDPLPGFSPDGRMVNGAHVAGYNAGNVGIALLGDFTVALPTASAYRTLVGLLAVLTRWQNVDPLAQAHYVNPISAITATVPALAGHRDWAPTQCPGNAFAPTLGQLRTEVATASARL